MESPGVPRFEWAAWWELTTCGRRACSTLPAALLKHLPAFDLDVDQRRGAGRERLGDELARPGRGRRAFGADAERLGKSDEVDRGVDEVHAHILIGRPA